jgi:hypothetical protein
MTNYKGAPFHSVRAQPRQASRGVAATAALSAENKATDASPKLTPADIAIVYSESIVPLAIDGVDAEDMVSDMKSAFAQYLVEWKTNRDLEWNTWLSFNLERLPALQTAHQILQATADDLAQQIGVSGGRTRYGVLTDKKTVHLNGFSIIVGKGISVRTGNQYVESARGVLLAYSDFDVRLASVKEHGYFAVFQPQVRSLYDDELLQSVDDERDLPANMFQEDPLNWRYLNTGA